MALRLGIDTGGTYTDAVLVRDSESGGDVLSSAKSLTTRHDLAVGIRRAVEKILDDVDPGAINLVSVSTTLATNAVVEGYGAPSCLVLVGQPERVLERARLGVALGSDPVVRIAGAFDASGNETTPLDEAAVKCIADNYADKVSGFAVAGYFAVRNPEHELRVARMLESMTNRPVTASHALSANLDAPRRALTALFNSRLIPMLRDLIDAVDVMMDAHGIKAPVMLVQGDGSLVAAKDAIRRPVETILSGPAASVIGAHFLAGVQDAVVSDIGGTTTDVAVIRDGKPAIDARGAVIGDWRTMVRAVTVHTSGLGGDSEIGEDHRGALTLGPRRAIPLVILADTYDIVEHTLGETNKRNRRFRDGAFAVRLRELDVSLASLTQQEQAVWKTLENGALDLDTLFADPRREKAFNRLRRRGLVALSTFTPTDAAHVLGYQQHFNIDVAQVGGEVWARRLGYSDAVALSVAVRDRLIRESARAVVETALDADGVPSRQIDTREHWFTERALTPDTRRLVQPSIHLGVPVVGIGAPATSYYPGVADLLGIRAVIPRYAEVCNAVGAAVAAVVRRVDLTITSPADGLFRIHTRDGILDFDACASAIEAARDSASREAVRLGIAAGAAEDRIHVSLDVAEKIAHGPDGSVTFVEATVSAVASAVPRNHLTE